MGRGFADGIAAMVGAALIAVAIVVGVLGFGLGRLVARVTDTAVCVEYQAP